MIETIGYWFSLTMLNMPVVLVLIFATISWLWQKIYINTELGRDELPHWLVSSHGFVERVMGEYPFAAIWYMVLAGSLQAGIILSSAFIPNKTYTSLMHNIASDLAPHAWIIGIPLGLWGVVTLVSELTIMSARLARKLK